MNREEKLNNIVLIGMSGVGKTAIGKYVAEKLNMEFIDTDQLVVNNTGQSIAKIFELYGEAYFRALEQNIIESLTDKEDVVISTGGGVVLNRKNIQFLKKKGVVFLLQASIDTIVSNIESSPSNKEDRPLLKDASNLRDRIKRIYETRKELYISSADVVIRVDNKSKELVGDEIISIFRQQPPCSCF